MLLQTIEEALRSVPYPARPEGLYEPIEYVLSMGGKRLRPTLLLLACGLYDEHPEKALPAAVGIETYHNHTLLHDDLMDRADMRRGKPTVHKKWNDNTAVLSGDTMLILAFRHVLRCSSPRLPEVLDLFARSAQEICEGQQYDVNFESRTDVTEAEYIEMIRLKTSVLLGCAVKMGALLGGAPEADADALYRFAEKVGLAFQLQDDYLDVYGDPKVFGKNIGGDIVCGKKTYLLISALNKAEGQDKERLKGWIEDKALTPDEKIKAVIELYNRLHIAEEAKAAIDQHFALAAQCLDRVGDEPERLQPLRDYAKSLLGRNV